MKKAIAILLVLVSVLSLCACGADKTPEIPFVDNTPPVNDYEAIPDATTEIEDNTAEEIIIPDATRGVTANGTAYLELGVVESDSAYIQEVDGIYYEQIDNSEYMLESRNYYYKTIDNKDGSYKILYQFYEEDEPVELTVKKDNAKLAMLTYGNGVCGIIIYEKNGSYYVDVYRYFEDGWYEWAMDQKFGVLIGSGAEFYEDVDFSDNDVAVAKDIVRHSIDRSANSYILTFYDSDNTAYVFYEGGSATYSEEGYFFLSSSAGDVYENVDTMYYRGFYTTPEGLVRDKYTNTPIQLPASYTTEDLKLIERMDTYEKHMMMVVMNDGAVYTASVDESDEYSHWVFHTELTALSRAENFVAIVEVGYTTHLGEGRYFFLENENGKEYWINI